MLEALGLEPAVEVVYRALLDSPQQGIEDLCRRSGLTDTAVRAALDQLAHLHLLRPTGPDADTLRPVNPGVSLSALYARRSASLTRRQRQLEEAKESIAALAAEYGESRQDFLPEVAECLDGIDAVRERLEELAANTKEECLSFVLGGAQRPEDMSAAKSLDELALERGVSVRSIYQDSLRNDATTSGHVRWLNSLGSETRTVPVLPMRMIIVDRKAAIVPLEPGNALKGALVLHSPGAVAALVMLFEEVWKNASPWGVPLPKDHRGLGPQERELLRLLAEGCTDEVAARHLAVSLRTVRRLAADLMTRLQAHSRFEAGVLAAREGWV
ncbi:LuxR family transcriptional regulator [Streptomyces sp. G44]|uniref:helix-turn-helix transcriptional regulator n=1 Tax=Streptomyces sp. G44 TaxID=2807632 RepID=UPI00195FED8A|nr:helix-turn-helix transcriptional regulator [Streptomyces sp. G44]MBM7173310.1 LuxR family transcriptional regulator [Streptomyces sp. G44]